MPISPDQTPTQKDLSLMRRQKALEYVQGIIDGCLQRLGKHERIGLNTNSKTFHQVVLDSDFWRELRQSYLKAGWKDLLVDEEDSQTFWFTLVK